MINGIETWLFYYNWFATNIKIGINYLIKTSFMLNKWFNTLTPASIFHKIFWGDGKPRSQVSRSNDNGEGQKHVCTFNNH